MNRLIHNLAFIYQKGLMNILFQKKIKIATSVLIFILITIYGCRNCKTIYKPDFTEDELSWVRFENKNPMYILKYNKNNQTAIDTITGAWEYTDIINRNTSTKGCEGNVLYKETYSGIEILTKDRKYGIFFSKIQISKIDKLSIYFGYLQKQLIDVKRNDTITINQHFYNDVYIDSDSYTSIVFSKRYGLVYIRDRYENEAMLIP